MAFVVYRIDTFPAKGNAYELGSRHENWYLRRDRTFANETEARTYVCNMNRKSSDLPLLLVTLKAEEREAFVQRFCFGDEYWSDRRYFLGLPPHDKIQHALRQAGISIKNE